jgi:hypothetical protein
VSRYLPRTPPWKRLILGPARLLLFRSLKSLYLPWSAPKVFIFNGVFSKPFVLLHLVFQYSPFKRFAGAVQR